MIRPRGQSRLLILLLLGSLAVLSACNKKRSSSAPQGPAVVPNSQVPPVAPVESPIIPTSGIPQPSPVWTAGIPTSTVTRTGSGELWKLAQLGLQDPGLICVRGYQGGMKQAASVTHYFIPPGHKAGDYRCRSGFGYPMQPEMAGTCLHPCRTLAADPRYHRPGEILFFKNLVGMTCGSGPNKMIHDGFMVVTDSGNPDAINIEGRFGVFWGSCTREQNGFCQDEGAMAIDFALTFSHYCRAWRPQDPLHHANIKLAVYNAVRSEAARRGDHVAASRFDLDEWIGLSVTLDGLIYRRR